eukprot:SAG31_NODE_32748_length_352_cov_0.612648_1_plen_35_part_01
MPKPKDKRKSKKKKDEDSTVVEFSNPSLTEGEWKR